ncbi:MAG: hypothetical protein ABF868_04940 [Sporolactobacillus sp.]
MSESSKIERILFLYDKLVMGNVIYKDELTKQFNVHERSIRRDIQDIRYYLARFNMDHEMDIIYDPVIKGYRLINLKPSDAEFARWLALEKVILASRILTTEEFIELVHHAASDIDSGMWTWFLRNLQESLPFYKRKKRMPSLFQKLKIIAKAMIKKRELLITVENQSQIICPIDLVYMNGSFILAALPGQKEGTLTELLAVVIDQTMEVSLRATSFILPDGFTFNPIMFREQWAHKQDKRE